MNNKPPFYSVYKRDMTQAQPTEVKGNAMCYLGTATAINNPEVSEAPVIIMAATQADLEQFMRGAGLEIVNEDWFYPVALLHQKDVKVVDDL